MQKLSEEVGHWLGIRVQAPYLVLPMQIRNSQQRETGLVYGGEPLQFRQIGESISACSKESLALAHQVGYGFLEMTRHDK